VSTPPPTLRVAAAQYPVDPVASLSAWEEKTARWVAEGAATGALLLVFPEYGAMEAAAAAGEAVSRDLARSLAAVADARAAMEATYARLAARHRVHILGASGPCRRADGHFVNAATLFAPAGGRSTQEKLVMTPFEAGWGVVAGSTVKVVDTTLGRIGIAICYDSEFPLIVRAMVEAGAELVLVPSCTERVSGANRIRAAALARALEGTIATVTASTVGDALWSPAVDRNRGRAGIYVPAEHALSETGVLAEGALDRPGWIAADLDLARLARLSAEGEMRNRADWALQPGARPLGGGVVIERIA
jgi:predicted amidohydrolase